MDYLYIYDILHSFPKSRYFYSFTFRNHSLDASHDAIQRYFKVKEVNEAVYVAEDTKGLHYHGFIASNRKVSNTPVAGLYCHFKRSTVYSKKCTCTVHHGYIPYTELNQRAIQDECPCFCHITHVAELSKRNPQAPNYRGYIEYILKHKPEHVYVYDKKTGTHTYTLPSHIAMDAP